MWGNLKRKSSFYYLFLLSFLLYGCIREEKDKKAIFGIDYANFSNLKVRGGDLLRINYGVYPDVKDIEVKIEWFVNEKKVYEGGDTFRLSEEKRGDRIYAILTPFRKGKKGKSFKTETLIVDNSPPVVTFARFETESIYSTQKKIRVIPEGFDPDGDPFSFFAKWKVGNIYLRDSSLEVSSLKLKRGDTVEVFVYARDDISRSTKGYYLSTTVLNSSPDIRGSSVEYRDKKIIFKVEAEDPDGDKIKLSLLNSNLKPLEIKEDLCLITFPYEEKIEEIEFTIKIEDELGDYMEKSFTLNVKK